MDQERIGKFIKKIRLDNNLTQKEFADKLGVTPQAVSKWEQGKNIPDVGIIKQISKDFNVQIDEILEGKELTTKKNKKLLIPIILIVFIIAIIISFILGNQNNNYKFKTISSKCTDFKITGSAAYNNKKATIYISNIEFCGKEDNTTYKKISCELYELYNKEKIKINDCETKTKTNLEDYLKELNISIDSFQTKCKSLKSNQLYLEIKAYNNDNQTITYTIPIELNNTCK